MECEKRKLEQLISKYSSAISEQVKTLFQGKASELLNLPGEGINRNNECDILKLLKREAIYFTTRDEDYFNWLIGLYHDRNEHFRKGRIGHRVYQMGTKMERLLTRSPFFYHDRSDFRDWPNLGFGMIVKMKQETKVLLPYICDHEALN